MRRRKTDQAPCVREKQKVLTLKKQIPTMTTFPLQRLHVSGQRNKI